MPDLAPEGMETHSSVWGGWTTRPEIFLRTIFATFILKLFL